MGVRYFGAAVRRLEDPKLITGTGQYVDDLKVPGVLHAAFESAARRLAFAPTSNECVHAVGHGASCDHARHTGSQYQH